MRALIVDDSRAMRSVLGRYMLEIGFETTEAEHGAAGLDVLETALASGEPHFDVVLVDWNMPVMDGLEFVRAMRSRREWSRAIVIMVSAENDRTKIARALMAGADEYVMKPVTRDILAGKLALAGLG